VIKEISQTEADYPTTIQLNLKYIDVEFDQKKTRTRIRSEIGKVIPGNRHYSYFSFFTSSIFQHFNNHYNYRDKRKQQGKQIKP